MYQPPHFRNDDLPQIRALMREERFATLISSGSLGVYATHHVAELTAQEEANEPKPWALSDAPNDYVERMLQGIVGFRFRVARLEGKWKMSQNRGPEDRDGIVTGLRARNDSDDLRVADTIRAFDPGRT